MSSDYPFTKIFVLSLTLLCIPALASASEAEGPEIPAAVTWVGTFPSWQHDGRQGLFRIVLEQGGFEHVSSRAYLQWIEPPRKNGDRARVVASRLIVEMSDGFWSIGEPVPEFKSSVTAFRFEATNTYTQLRAVWTLQPTGLGSYLISQPPTPEK